MVKDRAETSASTDKIQVQRVKNYDAKDIPEPKRKQNSNSKEKKQTHMNIAENKNKINKTKREDKSNENNNVENTKKTPNGQSVTLLGENGTATTKVLICLTYIIGATSVLYFLSSWWYFLGLIGLTLPLVIFFLAKQPALKQASGRVFFINLCATIVSALFWILYMTTRHYGIGFMSSLFRALQMTAAFVGTALIVYYFLVFVTNGKTSMPWLSKLTRKAENKVESIKESKVKIK